MRPTSASADAPAAAGPGAASAGVVGLGLIGTAIARRLLGAGFAVVGHDVEPARREAFAGIGGKPAPHAAAVAEACPAVVIAVFDTGQVEEVLLGANGLCAHPGRIAICVTTCDPDRLAGIAPRARAAGIRLLEAPVSGNSDQVARGNALGLIGGDPDTIAEAAPVLDAFCARRFHLGPIGSGGRAKLAINLMGGLNRAVLAEGLAFAESMGIALDGFLEVAKASSVYTRAMDTRGRKMLDGDFTPHGKVHQSLKDLELMQVYGERFGQQLPLASVYTELIRGCLAQGEGQLDNSAVFRELRRRRRST